MLDLTLRYHGNILEWKLEIRVFQVLFKAYTGMMNMF